MRTAIFDLDGTLVDTSADLIAAANAALEAMGEGAPLDPVADALTAFAGGRAMLRLGLERRGRPVDAALLDAHYPVLLEAYAEAIDHHSRPYPGAMEAVARLSDAGWRVGICTNKPAHLAELLMTRLGLRAAFGALVGADTLPVRKPDPAPYFETVRRLGGDPARSFLLGDTITDRDTARAAGVPVALVAFGPEGRAIDRDNVFPHELWREMGDLGLLGITVDEDHGGAGMGYLAHTIAIEEIARASASVSLSYGAHSNLCVNQIKLNGTPEQKARYLPKLVSGEHVGALAMSEAGAGSDVVGMKLRADKRNDRFVLNGTKYWITNGPDADVLVVYAKTDPEAGSKGITAFLIEKTMAGFSTSPHFDKLGMRGSNTAELIFQDVEVPFENILGEEGRGVRVLMSGLDYERVVLAGIGTGIMAACLDAIMPYMVERKQFGQSVGDFQLMQGKIADMYTAMNTARAYVYAVARACDQGRVTRQDAAACVLYASEQAMVQAHQAVQAMGGAGFLNDSPVARLFRDAKLMEIGAGTSEIRRMLIGREMMGAMR